MSKIILSKKFYLYSRTCCKWYHIIVNIVNCYKQVCVLKYGQLLTGLAQSMNNSGMRTCLNSRFIVITVVSSAKDIILSRSEQIVVYFDAGFEMPISPRVNPMGKPGFTRVGF